MNDMRYNTQQQQQQLVSYTLYIYVYMTHAQLYYIEHTIHYRCIYTCVYNTYYSTYDYSVYDIYIRYRFDGERCTECVYVCQLTSISR